MKRKENRNRYHSLNLNLSQVVCFTSQPHLKLCAEYWRGNSLSTLSEILSHRLRKWLICIRTARVWWTMARFAPCRLNCSSCCLKLYCSTLTPSWIWTMATMHMKYQSRPSFSCTKANWIKLCSSQVSVFLHFLRLQDFIFYTSFLTYR